MRILLAYYHCVSLGHSQRVLNLANALKNAYGNCDITILSGGMFPGYFQEFRDYDFIQLPSLFPEDGMFSGVKSPLRSTNLETIKELRQDFINNLCRRMSFDVVITEFFPFARKKLWDEFENLLKLSRQKNPALKIFCSVRDIVETADLEDKGNVERVNAILEKYYHGILAHTDSSFCPFEFPISESNRSRLFNTGYLAKKIDRKPRSNNQRVLICVGGGKDGSEMLKALHPKVKKSEYQFMLAKGPYLDKDELENFKELANVEIVPFNENISEYYSLCSIAISMCGYNSFAEILSCGMPYLFIPRVAENEQLQRCVKLKNHDPGCYIQMENLKNIDLDKVLKERISRKLSFEIDVDGMDWITGYFSEILFSREIG